MAAHIDRARRPRVRAARTAAAVHHLGPRGLDAVYQFDLGGDGGGKWQMIIKNDQCEVKEGQAASANITITMTASDYLDMINGKLNGQMAFMMGKLKLAGDMGLALRLRSLFAWLADATAPGWGLITFEGRFQRFGITHQTYFHIERTERA